MKTPHYLSILAALLLVGCGDSGTKSAQTTNTTSSGNPLNAPAEYVGALGRGQATAIKGVDTAALNQAVQLFNVQEGRNPKDLNELVTSKMIARIPEAPNGMKLDYDPTTGKVSVVKAE